MNLNEIRRVFDQAVDLPPGERASLLDRACTDPAMRSEVESLLRAHDTSDLMSNPTIIGPPPGPKAEGPGAVIGAYKLLQMIGEGGFGAVYMAEQERPVRRKVALKIIKLGMDTRQVIARFEAERQALAMMDHPNIARVLDAGATETGRPYFVMELVRGVPITEYCDTNKLPARERLDLFIQVCHAVQHAHQKGIIHRDIKPSNVLVTLHDGRPVPKVIDFGIAKATSQRLTDKTLFTEFRQFIGTPEYMSPEQAEMSGLDVDTRSDIYSLGVLLYELLTGTTPFDPQSLRNQGMERIQRVIREAEPPRPSARVDTMASTPATITTTTAADVARHRRTDPASLGRLLRGDLDWIVMRAIEKDRTRRYETATALADDVRRYLDDEPVEAGPPSATYRLGKFAKRNRVWLVPSAVAGVAFGVAFVGVVYGLVEARTQRSAAIRAQGETELARRDTADALERARRESDRNRAIGEYLQQAVSGGTAQGGGDDVLTLDALIEQGRDLFGGDHSVIGSALLGWASARQLTGDPQGAEPALLEACAMLERLHGRDDPRVSNARLLLARAIAAQPGREAEAQDSFAAVAEACRRTTGERSPEFAVAMEALTAHVVSRGGTQNEDQIADLWRRTVEAHDAAFGPLDRRTIREMAQFGQWLQLNTRKEEAVRVLEESIRRADQVFPDGDTGVYMAINSMILLEWTQNRDWAAAARWYDRLVAMGDQLGGDYARSGVAMRLQVAGFYAQAGQTDVAVERIEEFLAAFHAPEFSVEWGTASRIEMSMDWLSAVLEQRPDLGRRVQLARASVAEHAMAGVTAPPAVILERAGSWLVEHGFDQDAEDTLARSVAAHRALASPDLAGLGRALACLGQARVHLAKFDQAESPLREAISMAESSVGAQATQTIELRLLLGECLLGRERFDEAERVLLEATAGPDQPQRLSDRQAELLDRLRQRREAR